MDLKEIRTKIDELDSEIIKLLSKRSSVVEEVVKFKIENNLPVYQPDREKTMLEALRKKAEESNVDSDLVEEIFKKIIEYSKKQQEEYKS